ncbi:hypothetical protein CN964_29765 [Bacillus cereus]|uniref:hypothetical protein n=1 Tax=Bacillus cereus TaxID=1396 RepID=UPI000BF3C538|nr:hypothetical protein [Bacillus cereus]PFJ29310.1 hypothetical protein COI90_23590 [Bacillus cereus]PFO23593.1 hypothetical protein COJ80_17485 [Bacillus cereus]PGN65979.1 hypothetical protein CN964_29765 [Bacillus cereus]
MKKTVIDFESVASRKEGKSWVEKIEERYEKVRVEVDFNNYIQDELKAIIQHCRQLENEEVKIFADSIAEKIKPLIKTK